MRDRDEWADGGTESPAERWPDPVVRYAVDDSDPDVCATNSAFERVFDAPTDDASLAAALPTTAVEGTDAIVSAARAGEQVRLERACRTADGERTYLVRVVPVDGGAVADEPAEPATRRGAVVFTDVTDYRERLDERADRIERLERAIAVVSHDLQNPLDYAGARLDAARETGESEHFEKLRKALDRIERVSRDAMALTATDVETTTRVDLEALASDAFETVDADDATLDIGTLPTVEGDPRRLESLFENLFRNAVEHGGDVIVTDMIADGFAVADDGPGLDESEREQAFEPGYSTDDGGTGLGLAIVERTAAAHGWRVEVSDADGGARFEFHGVDACEE